MSFKKNRSGVPYLKNECPGFCCQERLTPQLFKRRKSVYKRFGILPRLCWAGIIGLS
jgi:hypothetical protein